MSAALTRGLAISAIITFLLLAGSSARQDTLTTDEDPHIGAGISYVTQRDMRLNPEHPPLMKDLAALPLVFIKDLNVPTNNKSWTEDLNGQWDFGREFIFYSDNNADLVVAVARIFPILITALLAWFVFRWTYERGGSGAGLLAITLFVFCPVILAHGHLVTTDIPAAFGAFVATYFLIKFLEKPGGRAILFAGIAFGVAELFKFSNFLLIPYFGALAFGWLILKTVNGGRSELRRLPVNFLTYVGGTILIGILGYLLVYVVYIWHVLNYPPERQMSDAKTLLSSFGSPFLADMVVAMTQIPIFRPIAQYLLGLFMVLQRAVGGNTAFFMGEVSATAWKSYFPIVYFFKVPLPLHIFTLIAAWAGIRHFGHIVLASKRPAELTRSFFQFAQKYFFVFASLFYIAMYWASSILSNLNIGVRHLMPVFPFTIMLASLGVAAWVKKIAPGHIAPLAQILNEFQTSPKAAIKLIVIVPLIAWYITNAVIAWPHYLSWYNEASLVRGGGHNIAADSNLDWGQDLKNLVAFTEKYNIDKIHVDYFGWAPPQYYLKEKYVPWTSDMGNPHGWLAVSATYKQESCAKPAKGFNRDTTKYCWLEAYRPQAIIGGSIFVYNLE